MIYIESHTGAHRGRWNTTVRRELCLRGMHPRWSGLGLIPTSVDETARLSSHRAHPSLQFLTHCIQGRIHLSTTTSRANSTRLHCALQRKAYSVLSFQTLLLRTPLVLEVSIDHKQDPRPCRERIYRSLPKRRSEYGTICLANWMDNDTYHNSCSILNCWETTEPSLKHPPQLLT